MLAQGHKYGAFDFLVADLTYCLGVDGQRTAAILTDDQTCFGKAKLIVNAYGPVS